MVGKTRRLAIVTWLMVAGCGPLIAVDETGEAAGTSLSGATTSNVGDSAPLPTTASPTTAGPTTTTTTTTNTNTTTTGPSTTATTDDRTTDVFTGGNATSAGVSTGSGNTDPGWGSPEDLTHAEQIWMDVDGDQLGWQTSPDWELYPPTAPFQDSAVPHGVRVSIWRTTNPAEGSPDSMLLVENYPAAPDDTLLSVTLMHKREDGYDPDNANWFYVRYNPDGTVHDTLGLPTAGAVEPQAMQGCRGCHRDAQGGDFIYINDP